MINGQKRYDVSRIETAQNNMDNRFKLRGGENDGLHLLITDYYTDKEIESKKLTNDFDADVY